MVLHEAVLRDGTGTPLAELERVRVLFSPRGLVFERRLLPQEVSLDGARIEVQRASDGRFELAFGAGRTLNSAPSFGGLVAALEGVNDLPALEALEQVSAEGLDVVYDDARAGKSWHVDDASLGVDLRGGSLVLEANAALRSEAGRMTRARLSYAGRRSDQPGRLDIEVQNAEARDIASQTPALAGLSGLDAPLSAELEAEVPTDGGLGPMQARLEIGAGALRPTQETKPLHFRGASAELAYSPAEQEVTLRHIAVQSDLGRAEASGRAYLRDFEAGMPREIQVQLGFDRLSLDPPELYEAPVSLDGASLDLRLRPHPFRATLGQAVLPELAGGTLFKGEIAAEPGGWRASLDAEAASLGRDRLLELWPESLKRKTRDWVAGNIAAAELHHLQAGLRIAPGGAPRVAANLQFRDATIQALRTMPPVEGGAGYLSFGDDRLGIGLEGGAITAPQGGRIEMAGTRLTIPDVRARPSTGEFELRGNGTVTALLSLLDLSPLEAMSRANLPVTIADGRAEVSGSLSRPLGVKITPDELSYDVGARVTSVRSDKIVPDRVLTADGLDVRATPEGLTIEGRAQLDGVPVSGTFTQPFTPGERDRTRVDAEVEISPRALDTFGIALPPGSVGGSGTGRLDLRLPSGEAPRFALSSGLQGVSLAIPALGWSKPRTEGGSLSVEGRLGATPHLDRLSLSAPGLEAEGSVTAAPSGGLGEARFDRLQLGDWLDVAATLEGQGAGNPPAIRVRGGTLDLRNADFGGEGGSGGATQEIPLSVNLDRLRVTEDIALTGLAGDFVLEGGITGDFEAGVNGGTRLTGAVLPVSGRTAVRLKSGDAGGVLRDAGFFRTAVGGTLDLVLSPIEAPGSYEGTIDVGDVRVRDAPTLAALIDAVSVVGLLQQLNGQGLVFSRVNAAFRLSPRALTVTRASATGPSLGLSLDGTLGLREGRLDMQGVVSPIYLLNRIGEFLTRPGEGLIGVTFRLAGTAAAPEVSINPLSALTPGMFRDLFRRSPPEVSQ